MNHDSIIKALSILAPESHWNLRGDSINGLEWLDDLSNRPTDDQITAQINVQ